MARMQPDLVSDNEQEYILGFPTNEISRETLVEIMKLLLADSESRKLANNSGKAYGSSEERVYSNNIRKTNSDNRSRQSENSNSTICKYFIKGCCHFGRNCWNMHESKPKEIRRIESICKCCGQQHGKQKENCPAFNKMCHNCKGFNHFKAVCKKPKRCRSKSQLLLLDYELKTAKSSPASIDVELDQITNKESNSKNKLIKRVKEENLALENEDKLNIEKDKNSDKSIQELKTSKQDHEKRPCLWCSRPTKFKCLKCNLIYCSRKCSRADACHYDNHCRWEDFCALCCDERGCDKHDD